MESLIEQKSHRIVGRGKTWSSTKAAANAKAHPIARQYLASFDLALSPEHVKILDDASPVDLGFPQELYAKEFPRALRYGGMRDQIAA